MNPTHPLPFLLLRPIPWLHALALLAVVLQPSQPATFLGRYSTTALIVLVALLMTLPLAFSGANRLSRRYLPRLSAPMQVAGVVVCVVGAAAAGWLTALPTPSYAVLFLYVLYLAVVAAAAIVYRMGDSGAQSIHRPNGMYAGLLLLLAAVAFAQVFLAARFPGQLWTDEGYNTGLSLSIARTGEIAVPFFRLTPELYGPNYSLTYFLTGAALNTFGVDLAVVRLVVYGIGLAAIALAGWVASRLYTLAAGASVALIAAVTLLPNTWFRADVEVAFWLAVAFWALWREERTQSWAWAVAAGWAAGFSLDGHPTAYRFIIVLLVFEGVDWLLHCLRDRRICLKHRVFGMAIGALMGAASYVLLYSALVPDAFGRRLGEAGLTIDLGSLLPQLQMQVLSALKNWTLLFGLAVLGGVVALRSRQLWGRRLVFTALGALLVFALTYPYYRDYYAIHLLPVYLLLAAAALDALFRLNLPQADHAPRQSPAVAALGLLIAVAALAWQAHRVIAERGQDYGAARTVAEEIRRWVPQDAVFLGVDPLYLRMSDYPRFVEFNTGLALALYRGMSEAEAWATIAPEAVAIFLEYPIPPPESLLAYLREEDFTRVACWEGAVIGQVDLYLRQVPDGQGVMADCMSIPS